MNRMAALAALGAIVASSCLDPTEIVLTLTTDVACTDVAANGVAIGVGAPGADDEPIRTVSYACDDGGLGTLAITPSGDIGAPVGIRVLLGVDASVDACAAPTYAGCIVARRSLRFGPHTPLTLPITLEGACTGNACDPTSTCFNGTCVDAGVACADGSCPLPTSFCTVTTPTPAFCMDFDEGDLTSAYAGGKAIVVAPPTVGAGATASRGSTSFDGTHDAIFDVPAGDGGVTTDDWYVAPFSVTNVVKGVELRFAWKIPTYGPTNGPGLQYIARVYVRGPKGAQLETEIFLMQTGEVALSLFYPTADAGGYEWTHTALPAPGWHHVKLQLTIAGTGIQTELVVDDVPSLTLAATAPFPVPASADFRLGISGSGPFAPLTTEVDDVRFDPL